MASFAQAARHQLEGRPDAARRLYRQVLAHEPRHFGALNNLGVLAFSERDLVTARTMLERAAAHPDHNAVCHGVLAATLLLLGVVDRAQEELNRALALDPQSAESLHFVGVALKERGSLQDAIACLQQALRINPAHESARNDLGIALMDAGRLEEAKACFEQVRNAIGLANLAFACRALGQTEQAAEHLREATALKPGDGLLWSNLSAFLQADHQWGEAVVCAERAAQVAEQSAESWIALGNARCSLGRHDEAAKAYARADALGTGRTEFAQNLLFMRHYTGDLTPREHAAQHIRWAERFAPGAGPRNFANVPNQARKLRVGYVSGDLCAHPVGYGLAPVLEAHDKDCVEAVCYASGRSDAWTERMRRSAALWRVTSRMDDAQLERQIVQDGIDILVDLSGHTPGNRLAVFSRKPAPVQVTWLGYFNTTGLRAMDYLIADATLAPRDEHPGFAEHTVTIEGCRFAWELAASLPAVTSLPCVERGFTTYGCFHKLAKVGMAVVETWAEVLKGNPGSRLVMKARAFADEGCREVYRGHFERFGIAADRVDLFGPSGYREYLQAFSGVDIALDPFPYSGETTTCEALQMGVPVVSMRGDRFAGRLGATVLDSAGLADWVAENRADYVRKAVALGRDVTRLAEVRAGLRTQLVGSVLCDVAGFTRKLEAAYREIWKTWCAGTET